MMVWLVKYSTDQATDIISRIMVMMVVLNNAREIKDTNHAKEAKKSKISKERECCHSSSHKPLLQQPKHR